MREKTDKLLPGLIKKYRRLYGGQYVALVGKKVVAKGGNRYSVFRKASKDAKPRSEIGVYYIPRKNDLLTVLRALSIFRNFKR